MAEGLSVAALALFLCLCARASESGGSGDGALWSASACAWIVVSGSWTATSSAWETWSLSVTVDQLHHPPSTEPQYPLANPVAVQHFEEGNPLGSQAAQQCQGEAVLVKYGQQGESLPSFVLVVDHRAEAAHWEGEKSVLATYSSSVVSDAPFAA